MHTADLPPPQRDVVLRIVMNRRFFVTAPVATLVAAAFAAPAQAKGMIDTIQDSGTFNTFTGSLKAVGAAELLAGPGPFTIFAPTDDAFTKIPRENLERLLRPENRDTLRKIILSHIVAGRVTARDVLGKRLEAATMNGTSVLIDATKGILVDDAKVVRADVPADNGIVHFIDTVIMPR